MKYGWKSIAGAVVTALGYLSQPGIFDLLPTKAAAVVTSVGAVLGVFGIRVAIANQSKGV